MGIAKAQGDKVEKPYLSWHNVNKEKMDRKINTREEFEPVIHRLSKKLKKKYKDFSGITFFGSRLRGDYLDDSDFDIIIMFSNKPPWQKENDVMGMVLEMELEYNILIDAKVYHDQEIYKQNTPFRITVATQGTHYG